MNNLNKHMTIQRETRKEIVKKAMIKFVKNWKGIKESIQITFMK